jgi:hypothetical protein
MSSCNNNFHINLTILIASVTDGVVSLKVGVGCGTAYSIAVCIVLVFYNSITRLVKYAYPLYRNNEAASNFAFETASFNRGSGVSHEII